MTPQMEKTYPAGVMRLGYMSETSAVVTPLRGRTLASAFTAIVATRVRRFAP